jgi:hypothetical protein
MDDAFAMNFAKASVIAGTHELFASTKLLIKERSKKVNYGNSIPDHPDTFARRSVTDMVASVSQQQGLIFHNIPVCLFSTMT